MNSIALVEKELKYANSLFHNITEDISEAEWLHRLSPDQNIIGYTLWHIYRAQDCFINIWVRGISEVIRQPAWEHWHHLRPLGVGIGVTLDEADHIAQSVNKTDVLKYADAVHAEITNWLRGLSENDLDLVPDCETHSSQYPEYKTPNFLKETAPLIGKPIWYYLMRTCTLHTRGHLAEVQLAKSILQAKNQAL